MNAKLPRAGEVPGVGVASLIGRSVPDLGASGQVHHFVFQALGTYHAFTLVLRACVLGGSSNRQ